MQDEFGDTALIEACDGDHDTIAALLIDKGAWVDYKNKVTIMH
jgi:ankyrin repeat protein